MNRVGLAALLLLGLGPRAVAQGRALEGRVRTGEDRPVAGATVDLPASPAVGTVTDSAGRYRLLLPGPGPVSLRVRAIGFAPATLAVAAGATSMAPVTLQPSASTLSTVVTTATLREAFVADAPVKVEVVSPALLARNATNNLMDNVSFLPGLTQQVDCGVCFTNNIRINGMDGPYTAVLIDGTPMMSALATVYGLNSIDPTQVEQLEIVKGPNSTLYGAEAMGGVINIVTKDPRFAPRWSVNAYATSHGETNLALAATPRIGRARMLLSVNGAWNGQFVDGNRDGFTDLPLVRRFSLMNKWSVGTAANRRMDLMVRLYDEDRFGGVAEWSPRWRGSDSIYGETMRTRRAEVIGARRFTLAGAPARLDLAGTWHAQNSIYGTQPFVATQGTGFLQGSWAPTVGRHALLVGGTARVQRYRDSTLAQLTREVRWIPGVFAQDEVTLTPDLTLLGGMRLDHHAAHGVIPSPRLAVKWLADRHTTVRLSGATGFRVVNLFTEDHAALTGARQVRIEEALRPERSATVTASVGRVVDVRGIEDAMTVDVDVFHTRFGNRIVADFDSDPQAIVYRNLQGHAVTRGGSVAVGFATLRSPLFANLGLTVQDVFLRDGDGRRPVPFAATSQGTWTLGYRFADRRLAVDWTGRVLGPMALPQFDGLPDRSPWFTEQHLQATVRLRRGPEVYVAVKNLFNYVQRNALIDPGNPFGDQFDTARVFGPLQGRRVLLGVRHSAAR